MIPLWDTFADLSLNWCQSFMNDKDYIILTIILESPHYVTDRAKIQAKAQEFMRVSDMDMSLTALNESNILSIEMDSKNQQKQINAPLQCKNVQMNPNMVYHLQTHLEFIKQYYQQSTNEVEKQKKQVSAKQCAECHVLYTIEQIHLEVIFRCKDIRCKTGTLETFKVDPEFSQNISRLSTIIARLQTLLDICRDKEFPSKEKFELYVDSQSSQEQKQKDERIQLEDVVGKYFEQNIIKHHNDIFSKSIRKRTDEYVLKKHRLLNNRIQIE